MKLWKKIGIGLIAGVVVGVLLGPHAAYLKPIGTFFIRTIKMLIVPLVFSSLVVGVTSMDDTKKMGRIGLKSFCMYLFTTAVAISIGLGLGMIIQPGKGLNFATPTETYTAKEAPSFVDTVLNMVPTNPIDALASGNILQIILFAILLGVSINLVGEKAEPVKKFLEGIAEIMYRLTDIVMSMAPYGVFALMAWVAGTYGLAVLLPLIKVILALYLGCLIHMGVTMGFLIAFFAKLNPVPFFKGIIDAQLVAYTTTSSSATLPVTMECSEKNHGVSNSIASFVLPLGATINMDGTALYQGVCALFIAQIYNVDLTLGNIVTIILTSTLASIGTAGVPGAGLIMLSLVLNSVGLPMEGVALVAGIDRVLDMARTMVNVTGDATVALLVANSESELNRTAYNEKPVI